MSDNNENNNEESDSLSPLNNNPINAINLLNNSNAREESDENASLITRLREQVQGLKNLSSLKQNLLNVREGQVKDLIQKLKFFEEAVANEKVKRGELNERVETAEAECADLAERLRANVAAFENAKSDYENRIVELIANLKGSNAKCEAALARVAELEAQAKHVENQETSSPSSARETSPEKAVLPQSAGASANEREAEATALIKSLKSELQEATTKNRVLSYQMTLLNTLFMETEATAIDFDRIRAIGDIVRGSMDLALEAGHDEQPEDPLESERAVEGEYLGVAAGSSERKSSFDVDGLIEKLDASNQKKLKDIPGEESCYKSIDTTAGPKLVLSVSRTFIKLKDLILEKKSLQKEIDGLKELNDKLSVKVDQQERRLYCVTGELNKTWSLVATLKAQHKQLHNSKAVLRYELQEKRKLLEKLKRDLSLSREKWIRVRQKNSDSEVEWLRMREEFTRRRNQLTSENSQISQEESTSGVYLSEEGQPLLQHSTSPSTISDDEQEAEQSANAKTQKSPSGSRKYSQKEGPSKSKSTESADVEDNDNDNDNENENLDSEELETLEEGACGIDYAKAAAAFDDPLDELEDLAEEIKTIEAAAATSDEEDDDVNDHDGEAESGSLYNGTELNLERLVNRRAARLQALEEQCRLLYKKLSASKAKSITLYTKLAKLHNHYGSDSDDTTTDQSHPTETSEDTSGARESGSGSRHRRRPDAENESPGPGEGYRQLGHEADVDVDLDTTELPSEMESQDEHEQDMSNAPLLQATDSVDADGDAVAEAEDAAVIAPVTEQPINSNDEPEAGVALSLGSANSREEQIASENRELQVAEAVGQSTNDHNLESVSRENATIVITDETMEQIARSQNHLIVRNGDVVPARPVPMPTSQYEYNRPRRSNTANAVIGSSDLVNREQTSRSHSHQNLASALTITNPVAVSTFDESSHNHSRQPLTSSSPIPMNPLRNCNSSSLNVNATQSSPMPAPAPASNASNSNDTLMEDELDDPSSPSDLSSLGRLIIQQLPKRLEILKHENSALRDELHTSDKRLKKTEEELRNEKQLSHLLRAQIEQQNLLEIKLQEELELQQQIIEELKNEIGNGKHCFDNVLSEKQTLSDFVELYNHDKVIHDQRFTARAMTRKQCSSCNCKFGLFKKKHNCKICGFDFCSKCSTERKFQEAVTAATDGMTSNKVKGHVCNGCTERREKLETQRIAATLETNV